MRRVDESLRIAEADHGSRLVVRRNEEQSGSGPNTREQAPGQKTERQVPLRAFDERRPIRDWLFLSRR
jgi:hypothetical protein